MVGRLIIGIPQPTCGCSNSVLRCRPNSSFAMECQGRWRAARLPTACRKQVLEEPRRGLQVADWHEDLTAARDRIADELDRLEACPAAATALDLARLRRLTENWPSGGWERDEVSMPYALALPRAISTGHFLRRVTGGNR